MSDQDPTPTDDPSRTSLRQFTRRAGIAVGLTGVFVLLGLLLIHSSTVLFLILASVLWAVFLRGCSEWIHERVGALPVRAWVLIFLVVFLGAIGAMVVLAAPNIAEQSQRVAETFPKAYDAFQNWIHESELGAVLPQIPEPEDLLGNGGEAWKRFTGAFTGALGVVGNTLLIFFVGIYFAIAPAMYKDGLVRLFPLNYRERAGDVLDDAGSTLAWWLVSRLISMFVVGVLTTIGLWALGVPLPLVLGVFSGVLTFVPVIGPIVSAVPAALLGLLRGPIVMLYVIILYNVVQAIENYLVMPYAAQKAVHLPPALVVLSQVLLGLLTGFLGVLMATPLLVVVMVFVNRFYIEDTLGETDSDRPESTRL